MRGTRQLIDSLIGLLLPRRFRNTVPKCLQCRIFLHNLPLTSVDLELVAEIAVQGRLVLLHLVKLGAGGAGYCRERVGLVRIVEGLMK